MKNRFCEKRGSVLLITVIFSAVVVAVVGSFIHLANTESRLSNSAAYFNNSLNLAEGGIEISLNALNHGQWDGWEQVEFERWVLDEVELDLGGSMTGIIRAEILGGIDDDPLIVAEGVMSLPNRPDVSRQIEAQLSQRRPFEDGAVGDEGVHISGGNAKFDSYRSSLGEWDPDTNRFDNGTVASNTVEANLMDLSNVEIYGWAATGGQPPQRGPHGKVYGEDSPGDGHDARRVALDYDADFPEIESPDSGSWTYINRIHQTQTLEGSDDPDNPATYRIESIDLEGHQELNIDGHVRLHVEGDVRVRGNGQINLLEDSSVTFYADNDFSIGGNGMANESGPGGQGIPENLLVYGTNPVGQNIELGGNADMHGAIYAPTADLTMSGGGDSGTFSGAVVANDIHINGNFHFHYDEDLGNFIPWDTSYQLEYWRELHESDDRYAFYDGGDEET